MNHVTSSDQGLRSPGAKNLGTRLVTTETIARWLRMMLDNSGIDTTAFGAHSTRAAATSAAKCAKLSVNTMMSTAGWANASTFGKFYDKPIISDTVETLDMLC